MTRLLILSCVLIAGLTSQPAPVSRTLTTGDPMEELTRSGMNQAAIHLAELIREIPLPNDSSITYSRSQQGWETDLYYSVDNNGDTWITFSMYRKHTTK